MTPAKSKADLKRVDWAISLAQADLQTLREGDWLNIGADLKAFIDGAGGITDVDETSTFFYGLESVQALVADVQQELRKHLERLASFGVLHVVGVGPKKSSATSFLVNGRIDINAFEGQSYRLLTKQTTVANQALFALASYLLSSGIIAGQIRKCPTCGRIFLLKRKPRSDVEFHCSLRCSRLAATRRYRKSKADELKGREQERKHAEYKKKQQQKLGPNVKVQRRPRKGRTS